MEKKDSVGIGNIGENYVMFKLSLLKISAIKLSPEFDFDIYTTNNLRIEVKTSRLSKRKQISKKNGKQYIYELESYIFHNYKRHRNNNEIKQISRDRKCDFFILVCIDDFFNIKKSYIN